jgi:hypothetical protein
MCQLLESLVAGSDPIVRRSREGLVKGPSRMAEKFARDRRSLNGEVLALFDEAIEAIGLYGRLDGLGCGPAS